MKRHLRLLTLLSVMFFLAGCSMLSPIKLPPETTYQLQAINPNVIHANKTRYTLLVTLPQASPGYRSANMIYTTENYKIDAFTRNRWSASPAEMMLPLITQSLQNTGRFKAVVSAPYTGAYDYRLDTNILRLEQSFLTPRSRVTLVMSARLIKNSNHRVIATQRFSVTVPAISNTPDGGVIAANAAESTALKQLAKFVIKASGGQARYIRYKKRKRRVSTRSTPMKNPFA